MLVAIFNKSRTTSSKVKRNKTTLASAYHFTDPDLSCTRVSNLLRKPEPPDEENPTLVIVEEDIAKSFGLLVCQSCLQKLDWINVQAELSDRYTEELRKLAQGLPDEWEVRVYQHKYSQQPKKLWTSLDTPTSREIQDNNKEIAKLKHKADHLLSNPDYVYVPNKGRKE